MTGRVRLLPALTVATARRITWWSVGGCIAAAVALTWLVAARDHVPDHQVVTALRWSAVLLAGGTASVLDDPTEDDLAGASTPVWWRRLLALALVTVPTVGGWAAVLTLIDRPLPWVAVSIEAAALVLIGCALASSRPLRRSNLPAGLTATLLPAVLLIVAGFLPAAVSLLPDPADVTGWRQAHIRWALLAGAAVVVLAATARDRARRPLHRTIRPARARPSTSPPVPTEAPVPSETTTATTDPLSEAS